MRVVRLLGAIWVLPVAIPVWLIYVLPCVALGWLEFTGPVGFLVMRANVTKKSAWFYGLWSRWAGQGLPGLIIINPYNESPRSVPHELRHTDQHLVLGPFFFPYYLSDWLIKSAIHGSFMEGYRRIFLEVDARQYADKVVSQWD